MMYDVSVGKDLPLVVELERADHERDYKIQKHAHLGHTIKHGYRRALWLTHDITRLSLWADFAFWILSFSRLIDVTGRGKIVQDESCVKQLDHDYISMYCKL